MGRSMLIICTGMVIVLGMIQLATSDRQTGITETNVEYFERSFAQNLSGSGVEFGIKELRDEDLEFPYEREVVINGYPMTIRMEDESTNGSLASDEVLVTAEVTVGGQQGYAESVVKDEVIYPPIPGATGFYGPGQLNLAGNAKIYGQDTNPDGSAGSDDAKAAIASVTEEDELVNRQGGGQYDSVEEDPNFDGEPSTFDHNEDLDGEELQEWIDRYKENRDPFNGDLGIPDSPRITVLSEYEKFTDERGAGILIVEEGVELELHGNFDYEGLVIVQGELKIRGTVNIYGSVLFGDNSQMEIEDGEDAEGDFSGDAEIRYSSSALANVNKNFADRMEVGFQVVSIFD